MRTAFLATALVLTHAGSFGAYGATAASAAALGMHRDLPDVAIVALGSAAGVKVAPMNTRTPATLLSAAALAISTSLCVCSCSSETSAPTQTMAPGPSESQFCDFVQTYTQKYREAEKRDANEAELSELLLQDASIPANYG
jgi:hypothetical protein